MRGQRLNLIRWLNCISILFLLAAAAPSVPAKAKTPQNRIKGSIRFELYRGYLMVTTGSVGPLKGLHFLLDTGTSTTLLDERVARKLELDGLPEEVNVVFFKGAVRAVHSWAPSIEIGPLRVFHRPVLINDLSALDDALPVHIDGIIGLDVLGQTPFEVDYRNRRIHFGPLPHLPVSIPLTREQGLAMVDVQVNHATAHLIFDTGTPSLLIFRSKLSKIFAGLKMPKGSRGAGAQSQAGNLSFPNIQLGDAEFVQQRAILAESRDEYGRDFDGVLSPAALRIDAFAVDLDTGQLELRMGL